MNKANNVTLFFWITLNHQNLLFIDIYSLIYIFKKKKEYDRFSYLISTKYARISFYQADSDISVYYQLNDGNYLNTSNPALCALLDSQMNKFDSTKELNVNVSLNGVDYTFTDKQSWLFYFFIFLFFYFYIYFFTIYIYIFYFIYFFSIKIIMLF